MHIPLCCLNPDGPVERPCSTAEEVHALLFSITISQFLSKQWEAMHKVAPPGEQFRHVSLAEKTGHRQDDE